MQDNFFKRFDNFFIKLINGKLKNRFFDFFFPKVTHLGGVAFISMSLLMMLIFKTKYLNRVLALDVALAQTITGLVVHSIKMLIGRERPYNIIKEINTFGIDLSDYSFPSGHSAAAVSLATIAILNFPNLFPIMVIYATTICISRIYIAVHYPTDVLMGASLGLLLSIISHSYVFPIMSQFIGAF